MGNRNRKATRAEIARARRVLEAAFPDLEVVFGGHGDLGGRRAPRDHTICFRLRDAAGRICSNVFWLTPDELASLTVEDARRRVRRP
jgi:hypothetical protein